MKRCGRFRILLAGTIVCLTATVVQSNTLKEVKDRGFLRCGVNQSLPGFSDVDDAGRPYGLDVEYCQGLSAAIFNDKTKVEYIRLSGSSRFPALENGEIDVLARNTTWTMSRDVAHGDYVGVSFYDGQGFMVRRSLGVYSAQELNGVKVCVGKGTTTELNAVDYFKSNKIRVKLLRLENTADLVEAYDSGKCDVFTTDRSGLAAQRGKLSEPDAHIVLPEIVSKEPLGPVVRQNDSQWADIARWSLNCWINAEEMGITRRNVNRSLKSKIPSVRRLLGKEGEFGDMLGLSQNWCYNFIALVGNYGESYARNVGLETPLKLKRGMNELWSNGGILYAPPIR